MPSPPKLNIAGSASVLWPLLSSRSWDFPLTLVIAPNHPCLSFFSFPLVLGHLCNLLWPVPPADPGAASVCLHPSYSLFHFLFHLGLTYIVASFSAPHHTPGTVSHLAPAKSLFPFLKDYLWGRHRADVWPSPLPSLWSPRRQEPDIEITNS